MICAGPDCHRDHLQPRHVIAGETHWLLAPRRNVTHTDGHKLNVYALDSVAALVFNAVSSVLDREGAPGLHRDRATSGWATTDAQPNTDQTARGGGGRL